MDCGKVPMGGTVRTRREKVKIIFECADGYGLSRARIIQDGKVIRRFEYRGKKHAREAIAISPRKSGSYVRVECAANDDRRAYSNPIYFEPQSKRK